VQRRRATEGDKRDHTANRVSGGVTISEAFVNRTLFKLIVIMCNTSTETLVDSTVDLDGDMRETLNAAQAAEVGVAQATLCGLPGANYDNLVRGTYTPSVELPDEPPLFPPAP
jgi:hypothetical protein